MSMVLDFIIYLESLPSGQGFSGNTIPDRISARYTDAFSQIFRGA